MIEIERKFIVDKNKWNPNKPGIRIVQGYLSSVPERTVRVRIYGDNGFLTIKGKSTGISRNEFEYIIPVAEAEELLKLCERRPIRKTRFKEKVGDKTWEVDVFEDENEGLVMAEVELDSEEEDPELPEWVLKEVSNDFRYYNSWLSKHPYRKRNH